MKKLIVISAFLVVSATNLFAQKQNSALEIKNLQKEVINSDKNQFKLFSQEDLEVDLNFTLNKLESYTVVIFNNKNQVVHTKKIDKEGKNKIYFTTKQEEEYTVKLYNEKDVKLVALLNKN